MTKRIEGVRGRPFRKGHKKAGGRKPGVPNRYTRDVKEAVLNAFERLGGEAWLVRLARREPKAFATLLGKLLPSQVPGLASPHDVTETARALREQLSKMEEVTAPLPPPSSNRVG